MDGMLASMRYRDLPTAEVTQRVRCDVPTAWALVTDIDLPTRRSSELQGVEWLDGATGVEVGARFRGHNKHEALGEWSTVCQVTEVEEDGAQRRWVYDVVGPDGAFATWAFEVEPTSDGVLIRQWGRMGPGSSGLTPAIEAMPDKEARIVANRLAEWETDMRANLEWIKSQAEG